jgi:NAD(P)-dependent dehydrogenase (short-subunit alcohol dehydrogenase family)
VAGSDSIRFDGQVVLVTGAGRGLGRAYALLFAERGADVVVHDAGLEFDGTGGDANVAEAVADEIRRRGGNAVARSDDLGDRRACEALVGGVVDELGRLDALVHNAGLVTFAPIEELEPDQWDRMARVNITAPFWLCRASWSTMRRQRYGRILLTVSGVAMSVDRAMDDLAAYSAGKAAQFGLMNSLAAEGAPHGILVNAISPVAATRMSRTPVDEGELTPEHVAPVVVYLASSRCAVTGVVVRAAGRAFSTGAYRYSRELDLGPEPAQPEEIEALLPQLLGPETGW